MTSPMPALSLAAVPGRRAATLDLAREIEQRGFSGIYCPSFGDAMSLCLAIAQATERIDIGTSIANVYVRHVADYAQSAAFLHEVSGGRFRFGVGVSHAPMNDRLGLATGRPLSDMRRFVDDLKTSARALRCGELPPIVLAGLRDRMCALATEVAAGVTFANVARSHVPTTIGRMHEANDSDRTTDPAVFEIWNMIPTCIADDREAAAAVNRRTLTMYLGLPNYRNYWKTAGYEEEMNAIESALDTGDRDALPGLMSDRWLADCTLFGSVAEVRDGIDAWFDAGVTTPIIVPSSASGGQMKAFAEFFAAYA